MNGSMSGRHGAFDEMTNLSVALRERCRERYDLTTLQVVRMQESKLDGTRKYLFELKGRESRGECVHAL